MTYFYIGGFLEGLFVPGKNMFNQGGYAVY